MPCCYVVLADAEEDGDVNGRGGAPGAAGNQRGVPRDREQRCPDIGERLADVVGQGVLDEQLGAAALQDRERLIEPPPRARDDLPGEGGRVGLVELAEAPVGLVQVLRQPVAAQPSRTRPA